MMTDAVVQVPAAGLKRPPPRRLAFARMGPRALLVQGSLLLALAALFGFIASNVVANIARLNVHTGFGFLARPAGFDIAQHLIEYSERSSYLVAFVAATLNTVVLAAICAALATALGFVIGLARLSTNRLVAAVAAAYVELVRNIPLLLQLFYWYFAVLGTLPLPRQSLEFLGVAYLNKRGLYVAAPVAEPGLAPFTVAVAAGIAGWIMLGHFARRHRVDTGEAWSPRWIGPALAFGLPVFAWSWAGAPVSWDIPTLSGFNFRGGAAIIPEFVAMIVGLTIYGAAFIAELVRAGVLSVDKGQSEAGLALGLRRWRVYLQIVVPQALRAIVPPLAGQYIHLLKNSSLGAAIAYPDLMLIFAGTALNQTGQPLEIMGITMATYLMLCLGIAVAANAFNRRVQLVER
ncbi:MAG: ABC transporter permease subunit [Proteobacteria bacterium]|nr:ABC transporter permease subunit [Pseudomonadota bacterium]